MRTIGIVPWGQAGQADSLEKRRYEPMKEYNEKLNLGKGSAFVKSHLSRLPRTDEVWEALTVTDFGGASASMLT